MDGENQKLSRRWPALTSLTPVVAWLASYHLSQEINIVEKVESLSKPMFRKYYSPFLINNLKNTFFYFEYYYEIFTEPFEFVKSCEPYGPNIVSKTLPGPLFYNSERQESDPTTFR